MNLEKWKVKRNVNLEDAIYFREMVGYKSEESHFDEIHMYYPEKIVSFVTENLPQLNVYDVWYEISQTKEDEQALETLTVQMTTETLFLDCNFYFELEGDHRSFEFTYQINHDSDTTGETEKIFLAIYREMKKFIEEQSPNRLLLVSSSIEEFLPTWLEKIV